LQAFLVPLFNRIFAKNANPFRFYVAYQKSLSQGNPDPDFFVCHLLPQMINYSAYLTDRRNLLPHKVVILSPFNPNRTPMQPLVLSATCLD